MSGPAPVEITDRKGTTVGLMFVLLMVAVVGLGMLFDPASLPGVRVVGALAALVFGLGAWLLLREAVRPSRSLRLDASGLRVVCPTLATQRHVPWRDLIAVRLETAVGHVAVVLDFHDPDARPPYAKGDEPHQTLRLPYFKNHSPERVAAEIERFQRACARSEPPIRREDMM